MLGYNLCWAGMETVWVLGYKMWGGGHDTNCLVVKIKKKFGVVTIQFDGVSGYRL